MLANEYSGSIVITLQALCENDQDYCICPTHYIGACPDLPAFSGGSISYDYRIFAEINGRPYGTVATYECDNETLLGEATRTCENGVWSGSVPNCGSKSVFCKSIFLPCLRLLNLHYFHYGIIISGYFQGATFLRFSRIMLITGVYEEEYTPNPSIQL